MIDIFRDFSIILGAGREPSKVLLLLGLWYFIVP
jgi:hypothetical protein